MTTTPTTAEPNWLRMDCAPLNGTLVRLLVKFDNHGIEDTDDPVATIGSHNDGEWNFVGWDWHRDEWTRGSGDLLGWLPMAPGLATPAEIAQPATPEPADEGWSAPDARKVWQGGLNNEELEQWWRLKLPNVEAKNRDISIFALGVEVGAGMGLAPKPDAAGSREGSEPEAETEGLGGEAPQSPVASATRPRTTSQQTGASHE